MATVILGSHPISNVPNKFDNIIYINGSISSQETVEKGNTCIRHHIVSDYVFTGANESCISALKQLTSKKVDNIIIIKSSGVIIDYISILNKINYGYKSIQYYNNEEKQAIVNAALGRWRRQICTIAASDANLYQKLKTFIKLSVFGMEDHNIKVSTGIFSIIYAINSKIGERPYYICGISLDNSGYSYSNTVSHKRGHITGDYIALKYIKKKYADSIISTNKMLSDLLGIKYYEQM